MRAPTDRQKKAPRHAQGFKEISRGKNRHEFWRKREGPDKLSSISNVPVRTG
jgi:hypothetical protein